MTVPWEWCVQGQCDTFSARTIQIGSRGPDNQVRNQTAKRQMRDPRGTGSTLTRAAPLEGRGEGEPTSPTCGQEGSEAAALLLNFQLSILNVSLSLDLFPVFLIKSS